MSHNSANRSMACGEQTRLNKLPLLRRRATHKINNSTANQQNLACVDWNLVSGAEERNATQGIANSLSFRQNLGWTRKEAYILLCSMGWTTRHRNMDVWFDPVGGGQVSAESIKTF